MFLNSKLKLNWSEVYCSRIYFVLGYLVLLFIFDVKVDMGLLGELILILVVVLCFSFKGFFS